MKSQIFMNGFEEKFINSSTTDKSKLVRQLERSVANYYCGIKGDLGVLTLERVMAEYDELFLDDSKRK